MDLNRIVRASDFFLRSEWPFWAPLRRAFIICIAIREGKMLRRSLPPPDMVKGWNVKGKSQKSSNGYESWVIQFHVF